MFTLSPWAQAFLQLADAQLLRGDGRGRMRFTRPFDPQLPDRVVDAGFTDGHGLTGGPDGAELGED